MIITMIDNNVKVLPLISKKLPPSRIILELAIDIKRIGMITGNPSKAIMIDWLLVFEAIEEIIVNANPIPTDPIKRFK